MEDLPSSISSSDGRRYVQIALGVTLGLSLAVMAIVYVSYRLGFANISTLYVFEYQRDKIQNHPPVDIAFVGDSALGYGIDSEFFRELSGNTSINLALNGSYGYGGSFNMIRRVLEHHDPHTIVIMQTLDTMTRRVFASGYFYTADGLGMDEISLTDIIRIHLNLPALWVVANRLRKAGWRLPERVPIVDDYTEMRFPPTPLPPEVELVKNPLRVDMINPEKVRFLERISELCRDRGLRCLYAHGTIYEGYCQRAVDYTARVNELIRASGLTLVEESPVCVPAEELGNSVDHVLPELKRDYTRRFYELITPYLGEASAKASSPQSGASP